MMGPQSEHLRRIIISGEICEEMAAFFLENITAFEAADINKPITIYIDTPGGSVDSALFMYDVIKMTPCPIITVGIGKVMSAGVLLLAAGDKEKRLLAPNVRIMIHESSAGICGSITQMANAMEEMKRLNGIFLDLIVKETGVTKKKLLEDTTVDYFMGAQEAIKYGVADRIFPTKDDKKPTSKPRPRKTKTTS